MEKRFSGKVVVLTASTEGIGYATAERLAKEGANVVISSRKQQNVDSAVQHLTDQGLSAVGCVCHVAKKEDRTQLIDLAVTKFGGIDMLFCNAGVNPISPEYTSILQTTEKMWDKIFDVNLKSVFFLCKEVSPYLKDRGKGSILLMTTNGAYAWFNSSTSEVGVYCTSKVALIIMAKYLSAELGKNNIRVNCIAPGMVKTKFSKYIWSDETSDAYVNTIKFAHIKRAGTPEECAALSAFLLSDEASYITGETVVMAGGCPSRL